MQKALFSIIAWSCICLLNKNFFKKNVILFYIKKQTISYRGCINQSYCNLLVL